MNINLKLHTVVVILLTTIISATVLAAGTENFKVVSLPTKYEIESYAYAVSADGSVIVGESTCDSGIQAFLWQNGTMVGLGSLTEGWEDDSYATAVSEKTVSVR